MKLHNDLIMDLPGFVPESFCKYLIEKFEKDERKHPGTVNYRDKEELADFKDSMELVVEECWDEEYKILSNYIKSATELYTKYLQDEYNYDTIEHLLRTVETDGTSIRGACIMQRQRKKSGYVWHYDMSIRPQSYISGILYLHTLEPDEGGCTKYINGREIKPECGKIMISPSTWTYAHRGNEFKTQYKYIIVFYVYINEPTN